MTTQNPIFTADQLRTISQRVLVALGTPADLAAIVSHSSVEANLMGNDSHGVIRLPSYAGLVRKGQISIGRTFRPFEEADALLEHRDSGVGITRIDEAAGLALETLLGLFGRGVDEALRQEERFRGFGKLRT